MSLLILLSKSPQAPCGWFSLGPEAWRQVLGLKLPPALVTFPNGSSSHLSCPPGAPSLPPVIREMMPIIWAWPWGRVLTHRPLLSPGCQPHSSQALLLLKKHLEVICKRQYLQIHMSGVPDGAEWG